MSYSAFLIGSKGPLEEFLIDLLQESRFRLIKESSH